MHIGKKIRVARVAKGWTQEELARRINKTRPLISLIEKTGQVSPETLQLIFKVLDVSESSIGSVVSEQVGVFTKGQLGSVEYYRGEIERLQRQVELLMQMLELQKEEITRLRRKSSRN